MNITDQLAYALRALLDADPSLVKRDSIDGVKRAGREALTAYVRYKQSSFSDDDAFEAGYGG